jgi:hypothetical protein
MVYRPATVLNNNYNVDGSLSTQNLLANRIQTPIGNTYSNVQNQFVHDEYSNNVMTQPGFDQQTQTTPGQVKNIITLSAPK